MDSQSYKMSKNYLSNDQAIPSLSPSDFYMIVEVHSDTSQAEADGELENFAKTVEKHIAGIAIAESEAQSKGIWDLYSGITDAFIRQGIVHFALP